VTELAKHVPGAPLTDAERQQRRDAARARWAAVGAGAAGAAGAAAAHFGTKAVRAYVLGRIRTAHGPVRAENARHATVTRALAAHEKAALSAIRKWPVPPARAMLRHDVHTRLRQMRQMPSEVMGVDPETGEDIHGPVDQEAAERIAGEIEQRRARLAQLADAKPPKRQPRKATIAKVPRAHTREITVKDRESDEARAARLRNLDARHEGLLDQFERNGATPDELEELRGKLAAKRALIAAKPVRVRGAKKTIPVGFERTSDAAKVKRRATTARRQGTPDDKALKQLRDELRDRVAGEMHPRKWSELSRHLTALGPAQDSFRATAAPLARWALPTRTTRRGLIGLGLGLSALGGYYAGRELGKSADRLLAAPAELLAKAAPDGTTDATDAADTIAAAGLAAQETMAERLAETFRHWKDDVTPTLLDDEPLSLLDAFQTGAANAYAPIGDAMRAGAAATVPVTQESDGGRQRTLVFNLGQVRNPLVEAYIDQYRKSKIAELTAEQQEAVTNHLIDAARTGASPDEMARRIRQTVGLTSNQSAQVLAYRRELEQLQGNALNRKLRDQRYDRTVLKAMTSGNSLTTAQIDAMVDAYHRRYLAYRAMTIARTEGVGAANNGHMAALQQTLDANPDMEVVKRWIAKLDEKTRPDHRVLNGQIVVGFMTSFKCPSGDVIRWPGDQQAPARAVINCRCTIATMLVPKKSAAQFVADDPTKGGAT
jgi:hypothetical protein